MGSAIIVEKLTGNSATLASPSGNHSRQFQFIDPSELESAVQQVRRDLNVTGAGKREYPHTREVTFPAAKQHDEDMKFVRHYATPRRVVVTKEEDEIKGQLPRLLNFEAESNLVLEKLQNILLEKPSFKKTSKNVKFTRKSQNSKITPKAQGSVVARKDDLDWLGPTSSLRRTHPVISPAFDLHEEDVSLSSRFRHSSPRTTSYRSSSASHTNEENLLFKTIQDTLKKIDDEESSIARRLANISFTSSSEISRQSSITEQGPVFPDTTVYRRPLRVTRDETCQTADEFRDDDQSVQSEPGLPSAAESILEQLEKEGFYETLLQHELDLIT